MDLKKMAAMQLAEEYHCAVLPERCPDCDAPLVTFAKQGIAFCIVDTAKHEKAQGDRTLLDQLMKLDTLCKPLGDTKLVDPRAEVPQDIDWSEYLKRKSA